MWDWQCPPAACSDAQKLGWINSATEEGQAWLGSQRGSRDFRRALDVLAGLDTISRSAATYRSQLNTNPLKRNVREIVGTLARLRPVWGYGADNAAFKPHAQMMNLTVRALYLENFFDLRIRDALMWAAATSRGFLHPIFLRPPGQHESSIELKAYGAPSVLPVQLPSDGNWQRAYAVSILDEMPIYLAHGMWPSKQGVLRPSSPRYWYANDAIRKSVSGNWIQRMYSWTRRAAGSDALQSNLLIPIRKTYVIDLSINSTDRPIPMGEPGTTWSYTVPYIGQEIPIGRDPVTGQPLTRRADENDARLYPNRRLLISSDTAMLYDGPNFDWHGMLPLVSFSLDDWPWEPLGFSLVHEGYEINEAIKELDRGNMDKARAMLDLPMAYDTNAVSLADARRFDPMQPRARVGFDSAAGSDFVMKPIVEADVYKIDPTTLQFRELLKQALSEQYALTDVMALGKLRAVGAMSDLEKIVEANGPIVEDMSRAMEPPIRDLGNMLKFLVCQYMTTARVMQYVGEDNMTPEAFDYNPASLVPSHLPGEDADSASPTTQMERARIFAGNLRFLILPNSLHEITQTAQKLLLLQLRKIGVKIDSQTVAEACNIPNYGTIPGTTVMERFAAEQEMDLEFAARMKAIAEEEGLIPQQPGAPNSAGQKPGASAPGKASEGRPPSFESSPQLKSKDNGTRSTISTSK